MVEELAMDSSHLVPFILVPFKIVLTIVSALLAAKFRRSVKEAASLSLAELVCRPFGLSWETLISLQ